MFVQKKHLLIFLIISSCFITNAQSVLESPNILWKQTTISPCSPDKPIQEHVIEQVQYLNTSSILKLAYMDNRTTYELFPMNYHTLAHKIFNSYLFANKPIYKDADLKVPFTKQELLKFFIEETSEYQDIKTLEKKVATTKRRMNPTYVKGFMIKQVVYFDKNAMSFKAIPSALGIVQKDDKIYGWIPVTTKTSVAVEDPNLNWIKRMNYIVELDNEQASKKTESLSTCWTTFFNAVKKNKNSINLHVNYLSITKKLLPNEIEELYQTSQDTTIIFDPETFEREIKIEENEPNFDKITIIKIMQNWAWDETNKELIISPVGFAPIVPNTNYKYSPNSYMTLYRFE